jgi:hypothetical protein
MSIAGLLDLSYFKSRDLWAEGWRPDGFFSLAQSKQRRIERKVGRANNNWALAQRLTEEAIADTEEGYL